MATTKIADVVVPEIFNPYVQNITEEKSRLIASGALVRSTDMDRKLAGGGLTFQAPSWADLDNTDANVSTDDDTSSSTPLKTSAFKEIAVRKSRNQSWSAMNLTNELAGSNAMESIGNRVGAYWTRELQRTFVAIVNGVIKDNSAAPAASEHVVDDLQNDVSDTTYEEGVTDFRAGAFLDAAVTMGDSMDSLVMVMMHSVVYNRAQKNNLIDFIPDSEGRVNIPTFLGRLVIVDDGMPRTGNVYDTWLFGAGFMQWGVGTPDVPTEFDRLPAAGDGGGQDVLHNRVQWSLHPRGHQFAVTPPANGGPSNADTSGNLNHADSWLRVYPERKQINFARLVTREA